MDIASEKSAEALDTDFAASEQACATLDVTEIARFAANATSPGRAERARRWLLRYNPARMAFMCEALGVAPGPDALAGLRILDVGCGTGIFSQELARCGASVTAIDPAAGAVAAAIAQARGLGLSIDFRTETLEGLRARYDVVAALEVIEHVPDAREFLRHCADRVEPGGLLLLSTINRTVKSFVYAIAIGEYVLGLLPRRSHQWRRFVRPEEIARDLESFGFERFRRSGATYDLRKDQLGLSPDEAVNYLFAARRVAAAIKVRHDAGSNQSR